MKSKLRVILSFMSVLILVISFQNCGKSSFQTKLGNSFELASENRDESDLSDDFSEDVISEIEETPTNTSKDDDVMPAPIQGSLSPAATTSSKGKIYYVATNGDDKNPGTLAKPFRTIARGSRALASGDTLYIRAGTYSEFMSSLHGFRFQNGTPNAYTRYAAFPGEERKVIIKPPGKLLKEYGVLLSTVSAYIEISGLVIDGANLAWATLRLEASAKYHTKATTSGWQHAHHIRILNNEIRNSARASCVYFVGDNLFSGNYVHNCRAYGIYSSHSAGIIENNLFQNNGGYGILVYGYTKPVNKWIVRNNRVTGNGNYYPIYQNPDGTFRDGYNGTKKKALPGVLLGSGIGNQFYNNLVYNNPNGGVELFGGPTGALIANNTIYNNGYGITIRSATDTRIINNLVWHNKGVQIPSNGKNTILKNNLITDPKVVSASGGDFRLRLDSPAINKGMTLIEVSKDFRGVARPRGSAYDIGAYEF